MINTYSINKITFELLWLEELVDRILQCCRASFAISDINFCAAIEIKRTILGSFGSNPELLI